MTPPERKKLYRFSAPTGYAVLGPDDEYFNRDLSELKKEELVCLCEHMIRKIEVLEAEKQAIIMTMNKFIFADKENIASEIVDAELKDMFPWRF